MPVNIRRLEEDLHMHDSGVASSKYRWVSKPLDTSIDVAKKFFSWTVGLGWLLSGIKILNLKSYKIELPTFSYILNKTNQYTDIYVKGELIVQPVAGFSRAKSTYYINWLNFIPTVINYPVRNLGKLAGALLASIYTVPANLIIRAYGFIKKQTQSASLRRAYETIDKTTLIKKFFEQYGDDFNDEVCIKNLVKHVSLDEFKQVFLEHYNNPDELMDANSRLEMRGNGAARQFFRGAQKKFYEAKYEMQGEGEIQEVFKRDVFEDVVDASPDMQDHYIRDYPLSESLIDENGELMLVKGSGYITSWYTGADEKIVHLGKRQWKGSLLMTEKQAQKFDAGTHTSFQSFFGSTEGEGENESEVYNKALVKDFLITECGGDLHSDEEIQVLARQVSFDEFIPVLLEHLANPKPFVYICGLDIEEDKETRQSLRDAHHRFREAKAVIDLGLRSDYSENSGSRTADIEPPQWRGVKSESIAHMHATLYHEGSVENADSENVAEENPRSAIAVL